MAVDPDALLNWRVPVIRQELAPRDAIIYALGVGLGHDPEDAAQLAFVYEDGLQALPTMATVLAHPGFWMMDEATGIDWRRVVHGEQGMRLHRPLPVAASLVGTTRITGILDKGPDRGLLVYQERSVVAAGTGEPLCTLTITTFCRGDGGATAGSVSLGAARGGGRVSPGAHGRPEDGAAGTPGRHPHPGPTVPPDSVSDLPTVPQAALIYRLSGDANPLHADPRVARAAGFPRPLLHGLCTFGVAGHALLRGHCDYDPAGIIEMHARFAAPVYPGETVRTESWRDGNTVRFRSRSLERDAVVLEHGLAVLG